MNISAKMMTLVSVGILLVIGSAFAAIPGPNDLRYPDYIVNPPVTCKYEGSFPHPRNCSWYYRCVDRMKVGYLWTYHFECEPGTVFSDELDQCVHPFDAPYACRGVVPTTPEPPLKCKGVEGTCKTYNICRPEKKEKYLCEEIHCPFLRSPNLKCPEGYAYDMDSKECTKIPTAEELCLLTCEGVPGTCKDYEYCTPKKEVRRLCKEIRCPLRQPNLSCGDGYSFDMKDQKCVKLPSANELCTNGNATIGVVETGNIRCAYNGHIPQVDFIDKNFCEQIALCDDGFYKGHTQLCSSYFECQQTAGGWVAHERKCPEPLLYSYALEVCVDPPSQEERC